MDIEEKAKSLLDEAMKDVKQEILIIDEKDVSHLVYIHDISYTAGRGLEVSFSTPDEDKDALSPLVHDAVYAQIKDALPEEIEKDSQKESLWGRFKRWVLTSKVVSTFANTTW